MRPNRRHLEIRGYFFGYFHPALIFDLTEPSSGAVTGYSSGEGYGLLRDRHEYHFIFIFLGITCSLTTIT